MLLPMNLGHSLSLADLYGAADSEKTMYGYSATGETKQRTLDQDDINGIIYLYGNNNSSTSTTTTIPNNFISSHNQHSDNERFCNHHNIHPACPGS